MTKARWMDCGIRSKLLALVVLVNVILFMNVSMWDFKVDSQKKDGIADEIGVGAIKSEDPDTPTFIAPNEIVDAVVPSTASILSPVPLTPATSPTPQLYTQQIPNTIWTYYPSSNPPQLIKNLISTYKLYNPNHTVTLLNDNTVFDYIPAPNLAAHDQFAFLSKQDFNEFPEKATYVGLAILSLYGGIYIDPLTLITAPIDIKQDFVFHIDVGKHQLLESFFLAAPPSAPWITAWRVELIIAHRKGWGENYHRHLATELSESSYQSLVDGIPSSYILHIAAHKVFQVDRVSRPHSLAAIDGPFKILSDVNWDDRRATVMLLEQWSEAVPRIIKLRQGTEWALLDDLINKGYKDTCIYKRFIQNGQASLGNLTIFGLTEVISYQPIPANSAHPYIPNKIWTYWHDGRPPPVVLDIIYGWKKVHPDYTVTILTAKNLKNHIRAPIPPSFEHAEPIAFKADWVRLAILAEQGGIWMDATIIVTSPLTWLPKCDSFLFHLDKFTNNPKHPVIEPWFIATAPSAPYITAWFNELNTVFSNFSRITHEYHTYLKRTFGEPTYNSLVQLNDLPYYLTVTITAMKVIMVDNVPAPCSTSAEMEPYKRIVAEEWNDFAVGVGLLHGAAGSERVIKLRRRVWEALVAVVSKVEEVKGSIYEKFIKGNKKWVERQKQLKVIGI